MLDFKKMDWFEGQRKKKRYESSAFRRNQFEGRNIYEELEADSIANDISQQIAKVNSLKGLINILEKHYHIKVKGQIISTKEIVANIHLEAISQLPVEYGIRNAVGYLRYKEFLGRNRNKKK